MRMKIAPGSLWLAYTLTSRDRVASLLPPSLTLTTSPLLADEVSLVPSPKLLFNVYRVDAGPAMQGTRTDILTLGKHNATGRTHLVMLDCLTDAMHWNPVDGVRRANAHYPPTRASGAWRVRAGRGKTLEVDATRTRTRPIDWTFAVEANLACYYRGVDTAYTMSFDEDEIMQPVCDLRTTRHVNTLWSDVRSSKPSHAFCHDHAMTFDVDVPDGFGRKS